MNTSPTARYHFTHFSPLKLRVEKNRTKINLSVVRRQNQTQDDRNMSKKFIPENNIGR